MKKNWELGLASLFMLVLLLNLVYAQKLDIKVKNNYIPGEEVNFRIVLYNENNQIVEGKIDYFVQNYYADIVKEGVTKSGDEISFLLDKNAVQGPWKITALYEDIEVNRLFNVGELSKAEISLDGDTLVVSNVGNVPYEKKILIYIGNSDQTASVYLDVGQTKRIKLTAPDGDYDVRVIEGNDENTLEFKGVSLTGNVVSLESVTGGSFWQKYPLVFLFLIVLVFVFVVVLGLRLYKKHSK